MNLQRLASTQGYALLVGIVVVAAVIVVIVSGGVSLGSDNDGDPLAIPDVPAATAADESPAVESDAGSSASAQANDSADAGDVAGLDAATSSAALRFDQPFQFGDLRIAVTDFGTSQIVSEGSDEQEALEQFASVRLTVRNTGAGSDVAGRCAPTR